MFKTIVVLIVLSVATLAEAQVLTTADTIGKGKQAIMLSENHLYDADVDLNVAYLMYIRGLTPRLDLYVSLGETNILGQDQVWVGLGGNARVLSVRGTSVSLFALASIPLHRQKESSTVLLNPAVVVSRMLNARVGIYTGLNVLVPVGARSRGLFTPPSNRLNVPAGVAVVVGNWMLLAEADLGKMKALGVGISRTF